MTPIRSTDTEDKTALRGQVVKPAPEGIIDKLARIDAKIKEAWEIQAEALKIIKEMEQK